MAKSCKLTESQIPERRATSQYVDIVADFIAQGAESMQVTVEGMKPETLRAGLRKAIKDRGEKDVRLAQRGGSTYLAGQSAD